MLFETVAALKPLEPDYVSVTYGAGGATRDGTVEISERIKREHGLEAMAHLSCVGETREGLAAILDRFAEIGIENVLALRGDPPRGEEDFAPPEDGLSSAAELTGFIGERHDFAIGGACFPEVHPEAADLAADLAYLKTKVDAGATLPDHAAVLRQPPLFRLRRRGARHRDRRADHPRRDPDHVLRPGCADLRPLRRDDPGRARAAMRALGGDEEAEALLGVAYAAAAVRGAARRRRPGNPLLRPQPRSGDPRRARGAAGIAPVGARRGRAESARRRPLKSRR